MGLSEQFLSLCVIFFCYEFLTHFALRLIQAETFHAAVLGNMPEMIESEYKRDFEPAGH